MNCFPSEFPGLNPRCLSHSANAAVLSPYYLPTFVTLTGILATQFRGPAVTAFTSAISSQIGLQLGTALSPPAVYVTGVVSGVLSTTLSVNFVVAASTLQQGAYIVAGLTYVFVRWRTVEESGVMGSMCVCVASSADQGNLNARIGAALAAFAPLASATVAASSSVGHARFPFHRGRLSYMDNVTIGDFRSR